MYTIETAPTMLHLSMSNFENCLFLQQGGSCMVVPSVSAEDAAKLFPKHEVKKVPSGKGYLRITPQP